MQRACLILALAVAAQYRSAHAGSGAPTALAPRVGQALAPSPRGTLLVDTEEGRRLLVLASDARIESAAGRPVTLMDIRPGDVVAWRADGPESVNFVDELSVMAAPRPGRES